MKFITSDDETAKFDINNVFREAGKSSLNLDLLLSRHREHFSSLGCLEMNEVAMPKWIEIKVNDEPKSFPRDRAGKHSPQRCR